MTTLGINSQGGIIQAEDIPPRVAAGAPPGGDMFDIFIEAFLQRHCGEENLLAFLNERLEARLLTRLEALTGNNKTAMAQRLGISRVTLQKKLAERR